MLPDFPEQKEELAQFWNEYLQRRYQEYLGYFSEIPKFRHHEGKRWRFEREDGSTEDSHYKSVEEGFSVSMEEVPDLTLDKIRGKLDKVAEGMARTISQQVISDINQTLDKTDRAVDAKGRPFSKELFLEALDSMLLSFDDAGELQAPALIMHPDMWNSIQDEIKTWDDDPEFDKKYKQLLERKRDEWRVRESSRKLVD